MSTVIQRNLSGGELDPALYPRADITRYQTSLRTMRNFVGMRSSGVEVRPGSKKIARTKYSDKKSRLIQFGVSASETYNLEFGHEYIRVHTPTGPLSTSLAVVTGITAANPAVFSTAPSSHGFLNGEDILLTSANLPEVAPLPRQHPKVTLSSRVFRLANVTDETFTLKYLDGPNSGSDVSTLGMDLTGATGFAFRVDEIVSPYQESELFELNISQNGSTILITHPNHGSMELSFSEFLEPTFQAVSYSPSIATPTGFNASGDAETNNVGSWRVTAIANETFEESLPSPVVTTDPRNTILSWNAVAGAMEYNIYKWDGSAFGLLLVTEATSWEIDIDLIPNRSETPPITRNPDSLGGHPRSAAYVQQRLALVGSSNSGVYLSRTGLFKNFTTRSPLRDDDAVTFFIAGKQRDEIRHILDLGRLVILTANGEFIAEGGADGVLTPFAINLKQQSYFGASRVSPITTGRDAIYVQARSGVIRALKYRYEVDGLDSNDLTAFSAHLFRNRTVTAMTFQDYPRQIVWVVTEDGALLGMTYIPEHEIFGWHRHDTDGQYESVSTMRQVTHDAVSLIVKRTLNGTSRYIEIMDQSLSGSIDDLLRMDCALTYDGRKGGSSVHALASVTLTGGTNWDDSEVLTLTATGFPNDIFDNVGNTNPVETIHVVGPEGDIVKLTVTAVTSDTTASVRPDRIVPSSMRGVAIADWRFAAKQLTGLWHLEGKKVSILADGFVIASPNNPDYPSYTVTNGSLTLDNYYSVIHVGLPFIADLETLDIESGSGTLIDKRKIVQRVSLMVESSRGIWVGPKLPFTIDPTPLFGMTEKKGRSDEPYDDPPRLMSGVIDLTVGGQWSQGGRVAIRQVDPLPLKVLAVAPSGIILSGGA